MGDMVYVVAFPPVPHWKINTHVQTESNDSSINHRAFLQLFQ